MHSPARSLPRLVLFLLLASLPLDLAAQSGLTLIGGPATWDLSGVGTGTSLALRWDRNVARAPVVGPVDVEAGVGWFQDGQTGQGAVDLLIPEVGIRFDLLGPVRLGLGAGWAIGLEDRTGDDPTLWAGVSAGVGIGSGWSLRPELRVRSVDPWVGTITEYSVGIRRALR